LPKQQIPDAQLSAQFKGTSASSNGDPCAHSSALQVLSFPINAAATAAANHKETNLFDFIAVNVNIVHRK